MGARGAEMLLAAQAAEAASDALDAAAEALEERAGGVAAALAAELAAGCGRRWPRPRPARRPAACCMPAGERPPLPARGRTQRRQASPAAEAPRRRLAAQADHARVLGLSPAAAAQVRRGAAARARGDGNVPYDHAPAAQPAQPLCGRAAGAAARVPGRAARARPARARARAAPNALALASAGAHRVWVGEDRRQRGSAYPSMRANARHARPARCAPLSAVSLRRPRSAALRSGLGGAGTACPRRMRGAWS